MGDIKLQPKELIVKLNQFDDKDYKRLYKVISRNDDNTINVECISETVNPDWKGQQVQEDGETLVGRVFEKVQESLFVPFM